LQHQLLILSIMKTVFGRLKQRHNLLIEILTEIIYIQNSAISKN
jgi:hypothetical protein